MCLCKERSCEFLCHWEWKQTPDPPLILLLLFKNAHQDRRTHEKALLKLENISASMIQ